MQDDNHAVVISEFDRDFMELILENSKDILIGKSHQIEAILPADFWESQTNSDHKSIGRAFMRLSKAGLIPYQFIGRTSANHNLYKRLP